MRAFSGMTVVLLQLIVGSMNLIAGLLAITFYLNQGPAGVATSPATFAQISLLTFIFGVLSFTIALAAIPALNGRLGPTEPQPQPQPPSQQYQNYYPQARTPIQYEYSPPQVTTREYVTQRRQTLVEKEWVGLACPDCGRNVSRSDNFCDQCGAQFQQISELGSGLRRANVEKA